MAAKFTRLYHYRGETQSYTVPLSASSGDVENVTFAIRDKENGQILVEFDRDTYPSLFVLGSGSMSVTLDAVGMSGSSTNGIVAPQLFSKNGSAYLVYDITTETASVTLVEQYGTFVLRADVAVPVDPQQLALRLTTDIVDALTSGEDPSGDNPFLTASGLPPTLPGDVLDAIAGATAPSVLNPFATISVVKDYAIPADAVLVDAGATGDYSSLSEALSVLNASVTSNNRGKIVVRGNITETYQVSGYNYIDVFFQEDTTVIVDGDFQGPAVMFSGVFDATWQAYARRTVKFRRRTGNPGGFNYGLHIANPAGGRVNLRGLVFINECDYSVRNYGGLIQYVNLDDCEFHAAGTFRPYGVRAEAEVYANNSDFYGGDSTIGTSGFGSAVPVGIVLAEPSTGVYRNCRAYGGNAGVQVESHAWWGFCYMGQNGVTMIDCVGYGGIGDGGFNDGINLHKSATGTLVNCVGISGNRGNGIAVYGQSGNYARWGLINCVGICRNQDSAFYGSGLNYGDGAARDRIVGGTYIGSPFVPSAGANIDIAVDWAGANADNAYSEWEGVTLVGGGAWMEAQGMTTHQPNSPALRFNRTANPIRFAGCHLLSNINSPAVKVLSTAIPANIQFDGGDAKSMNPAAQKAIESDIAWNNAEIYNMILRGGLGAGITPKMPTMVGTNFVP